MPLFVCDECKCIENTALCNFWSRHVKGLGDGIARCSECDPDTLHWHNKWPKQHVDDFLKTNKKTDLYYYGRR